VKVYILEKKTVIGLTIALLVSLLLLYQVLHQREQVKRALERNVTLEVGEKVIIPEFVYDILGRQIDLTGSVLFIFFDPACPACVEEAPIWNDFYRRAGESVKVIGVSNAEKEKIQNFIRRMDIPYSIVHDRSESFYDLLSVSSVPNSVLYDNGKIAFVSSRQSPAVKILAIETYLGIL
jgi:peroxiredoxin